MRRAGMPLAALALAALGALAPAPGGAQTSPGFTLTSPAFEQNGAIPLRHSAYGDNLSPALNWTGAPSGTQSFALVLEDPDANNFVHWVIYNIPGSATGLPEGIPAEALVSNPEGARQGQSGLRRTAYFGPRPPAGAPHRYNFRLFALHSEPNLPADLNRDALLEAIQPHAMGEAVLTGVYQAQ